MVASRNNDREIRYEIIEHIGVISSFSTGWKKELNIVKWNDGTAKYDIRDWDPEHEHMSRGITLHDKEMEAIVKMVCGRSGNQNGNAQVHETDTYAASEPEHAENPEHQQNPF